MKKSDKKQICQNLDALFDDGPNPKLRISDIISDIWEVNIFPSDDPTNSFFEDDGAWFIDTGKHRFCFDIGQEVPTSEFNRIVKNIHTTLLNWKKEKVTA